MTISKATVEDIPQLLHLVNNAYRGEEARNGWTHEADLIEGVLRIDAEGLQKLLSKPTVTILKYADDKKIEGCVYLDKQNDKLYLGMLSVLPNAQANGIGKKLMQAAEEHAKKINCSTIEMTVINVRNELIAWYQRRGYRPTGKTQPFEVEEKFGKPTQPIHFIVMHKQLLSFYSNSNLCNQS